ncbi:MAG TPA: GNAT family N-acetyltransferase [Nocardioidaceae bacterium]|nr:GNAT family N-acetyltransferase [Nocardioidaceae bacterium]
MATDLAGVLRDGAGGGDLRLRPGAHLGSGEAALDDAPTRRHGGRGAGRGAARDRHDGPEPRGARCHIGTASFLVAGHARGRGVGRALATYVVEWHRAHGFRGIQFNAVVETNTVAVALWRSLGFQVVGTVPGAFHHPEHGYVGLHVMFLPLA